MVITAEMESGLAAGDDLVPFRRSRSQFRRERRQGQHTQSQMSFPLRGSPSLGAHFRVSTGGHVPEVPE
ncbi:hypothetical protein TNCV_3646491 [Trichonephila clavipes]|nr:hypothetical protein TNCV_3646491 [Trichonephila clavipes]